MPSAVIQAKDCRMKALAKVEWSARGCDVTTPMEQLFFFSIRQRCDESGVMGVMM